MQDKELIERWGILFIGVAAMVALILIFCTSCATYEETEYYKPKDTTTEKGPIKKQIKHDGWKFFSGSVKTVEIHLDPEVQAAGVQ